MKGVLKKIARYAPMAASFMTGGAAGPIAELAKNVLSGQLGTRDATPETLAKALDAASPDTLARVRESDNQFKVEMEKQRVAALELGVRSGEADHENTADARRRQIAMGDRTPDNLAYMITLGYLAVIGFGMWMQMLSDPGYQIVLHGMISIVMLAFGYFLGSSNKKKDSERS